MRRLGTGFWCGAGGALRVVVSVGLGMGVTGAAHAATPDQAPPLPALESPPPAPTDRPPFLGGAEETPAAPEPTPAVSDALPAEPVVPVAPPAPVAAPTTAPPAPGPVSSATPDPTSWSGLPPLQVHAFASQGAIKSTKNNYLVKRSVRGSVELTEVAINFTQPLTDRLRMGLQLFSSQIGAVGDFHVQADWYYLDYRFADWLGLRAGRTKVPFGLYNEINDIDAARVPILLPQSVYPLLSRDLLLAQTGAELYGYLNLTALGGLEYRAYGGTLYATPPSSNAAMTLTDYRVPYVFGGRLMWETPIEGLRVGGSYLALRAEIDYSTPAADASMGSGKLNYNVVFHLWMASLEYARNDLLLAAEFGEWGAVLDSTAQAAMQPPASKTISQTSARYHAMAAYRVASWLMPGVYYAGTLSDTEMTAPRQNHQHDFAATLRFDVNSFWLVKLEGHYMLGTNDVSPALNDGTTRDHLTDRWFLFLAKTTVYF